VRNGGWAEARCWVLRNRAGSLRRGGSVFLGHLLHQSFGVGVVVWLGPVFTKPLVMILLLGVFSLGGGLFGVGGGCGWCSCPYFENCIVDASIFVVFVV
jgi:hypothetical protein